MIIDFRREMNDKEYEKYINILGRRIDKKWLTDEFGDVNCFWNEVVIDRLICVQEDEYLQGLEAKVEACIKQFTNRGWVGHRTSQHNDNDAILWSHRKDIHCVIIYDVTNRDNSWILFKNSRDYDEYNAKYYGVFNGGISLLSNGWVKQKSSSEEKTKWAFEELKDDFLHDSKIGVYYFRPEAAMAFKLRWE